MNAVTVGQLNRYVKSLLDGDGRLHITGRKKDVLVLPDGTKLFLPEYEGRIMETLGTPELAVYHWNPRTERNVQVWLPIEKVK